MRTSQIMAFTLIAGMGAAGCDGDREPTLPEAPRVARIEAVTATDLTGTVGTDITPPPTVRAVDSHGGPVRGFRISFQISIQAGSGGGTITNTSAETDAQGLATVGKWTLGPAAGTHELKASSEGLAPVVFRARAEPGPVAQISEESGDEQIAVVGDALPKHLVVRVADSFGNPIAGAPVTFTVIAGDGTIENSSVVTDPAGLAESGAWTLGPTPGVQQVRAESGTARVVFTARAEVGPVAQITIVNGNDQIAGLGEQLVQPLRVKVADSFGNPIDGAPVTFTVIAGDGSIENSSVVTDPAGFAESGAWTLGPTPGVQQVRAESGSAQVVFSALAIAATDLIAFTTFTDLTFTGRLFLVDATGRFRKSLDQEGWEPAWSPDGTKIAFTRPFGGANAIYVMNQDGSGVTRLTGSVGAYEPAWSPDGTKIAFARDFVEIFVMNADGSGLTQLTDDPAYNFDPAWSPDGTKIAFVSDRSASKEIYVMNADGSELTQLTDDPAYDFDPAWSPDGTKIAFVSDRTAEFDIYVMNADGSGVTRLTNGSVRGEAPTWSPDGTRIAFAGGEGEDWYEIGSKIYVMNADGSAIRLLAPCAPSGWCFAENGPAWHP